MQRVYASLYKKPAKLFSTVAITVCIPISNVWMFQSLHVLTSPRLCQLWVCACSICLYVCLPMGLMVCHRGLSLYFLVNDGVEPLLRCLFTICISGEASLAHFLGGVCFLIVEFWEFSEQCRSEFHTSPTHCLCPSCYCACIVGTPQVSAEWLR